MDGEGGSLSGRADYGYVAAALSNDAVGGGEAEAGALGALGAEEGLEHPRAHLGTHAGTGIRHRHDNVGARSLEPALARHFLLESSALRGNDNLTAVGH